MQFDLAAMGAQAASQLPQLPLLPGVSVIDDKSNKAPLLLVMAFEKVGKSATTIMSTIGWPTPEHQPLVLAWDSSGPVSCLKLGYRPHSIDIQAAPGALRIDRARHVLAQIEQNIVEVRKRYGVLIIDCTSTMLDRLHEDARRTSKNPDPRSHYGEALLHGKEFINRVQDLGIPSIWLSWLRDAETVEQVLPNGQKSKRVIMGGPNIIGNVRTIIAGKAQHIFILDKEKHGPGAPGADEEGYVRVVHSRPWNNINAGGRYSHVLPEPCPPHFGWILSQITHNGPWTPK